MAVCWRLLAILEEVSVLALKVVQGMLWLQVQVRSTWKLE